MIGTGSHRTRAGRSRPAMFFAILVIVSSSVLQGYAESISRMQNSKPSDLNDITPSPMVDGMMSTNGWRPMISSSIAPSEPAPTKQHEDSPAAPPMAHHRIPPLNGPPKGHAMVNRHPPLKMYSALPLQSHHPAIDLTSYVEDYDDTMRPRPRRQKKRPPFKTVDQGSSLGLIASSPSDPIITFRGANSDSPFIRHVVVTEPSFSRLRPHQSGLRGAPPPAQHGLFQADPSQEMLPPTTAPQPSRPSAAFDVPPHLRGRPTSQHQHHHHHHPQAQFHGPSFYFHAPPPHAPSVNHQHHHQMHQQTPPPPHAYPAVARPAEPLPGSLLRPHKERLTDSSAFRTGGVGFQNRPSPVMWPDSLVGGRVHFSVTSTPLVEERPSHWDEAVAGRQEGKVGDKQTSSLGIPQRGESPKRGKPQDSLENVKGRPKPHREPGHGQHQVIGSTVEEAHVWGGVGGASAELHGLTKDPTEGSTMKNNGFNLGPPPTRASKKPMRGNVEGKRHHQGMRDGGHMVQQRPHENEEPGPTASEAQREERPRPAKHRHNPNYRKKIENGDPKFNINGETTTDHQPLLMTQVKLIPSGDVNKGLRGDNGGQRAPGVRKRRPKPNGNRQPLYTKRPVEIQEPHQQPQEQYQPVQQFHQQQNPQQQEQNRPTHLYNQQQNIQQQEHYQPVEQYKQQQNTQQQEEYQPVQQYKQQQQNTQRHPQEGAVDQYRQQVLDQEAQPQQQEVAEPQRQHEPSERLPEPQPTEGQRSRKRGRRPSRTRKPAGDTRTRVDGENQLAPAVRAEEQEVKWPTEARPRPILRSRRPKPEVQPTSEPEPQGVTATTSNGEREYSEPSGIRKARPTASNEEEKTIGEPASTRASYKVKEVQEDIITNTEVPQIHSSEETYHREQEQQLAADPTSIPLRNLEQATQHEFDNVPPTAEGYGLTTAREEVEIVPPTAPTRIRSQRIPDPSTTLEAATTTEAPTTTVKPTSSAYGIRSRIRTGSRPRFSVKDYRERLNRLSQLSGRGKNGTEDIDAEGNATARGTTATGAGATGPGRERWYPGRRQQQTLQEQQQLQHLRLQSTSSRNEGQEVKEEKQKSETVRERYRVRAPALRQRPTAPAETTKGTTAPGGDKQEETTLAPSSVNRYRSRYGGRFSTTTASTAEGEVTTTENPTSRRRGILTTYGMRRPLPLRLRPGQTTTTESAAADSTIAPMTTTDSFEETTTAAASPVISTTEAPTTTAAAATTVATTTTSAPPPTTTEEAEAPRVVENEVTVHEGGEVSAFAAEEEEEDGVDLKDGFIRPGQLVSVGAPVAISVLTESGSEESEEGDDGEISPEQRVSDLTVWATTGQTGAVGKGAGRGGDGGGGLVTFSAVSSYPSVPFSPRLVTMATEDPVLPLEAFFFGPSASGGKSPGRAR